MNGMSCASCHAPSKLFKDGLQHDIGSVEGGSPFAMDGAMDTPTLLSSASTPPYFHDGSLPTLGSVVDWFDERYGLGLKTGERMDLWMDQIPATAAHSSQPLTTSPLPEWTTMTPKLFS